MRKTSQITGLLTSQDVPVSSHGEPSGLEAKLQVGPDVARFDRRGFVARTVGAAALASTYFAAPRVVTASRTASELVIGEGDFQYRVHHHWPQ